MKKLKQSQSNRKLNGLIKEEMRKQAVSTSELAKRLGIAQSSAHNLLERSSIQVSRLASISKALEINFFQILADQINIQEPVNTKIEELEQELSDQKKENEVLKEVVSLLGRNK